MKTIDQVHTYDLCVKQEPFVAILQRIYSGTWLILIVETDHLHQTYCYDDASYALREYEEKVKELKLKYPPKPEPLTTTKSKQYWWFR